MTGIVEAHNLRPFVAAYGAAYAGATIAFLPLVVVILPAKAAQIAGAEKLQLLSFVLLSGAITASIANILAGWCSDYLYSRTGGRLPQIVAGLLATLASLIPIATASSWAILIVAVVAFQTCLNFLLSPLSALLADKVPESAKGRTSAWINIGVPIATLVIGLITLSPWEEPEQRLGLVGALTAALFLPLLLIASRVPNLTISRDEIDIIGTSKTSLRADLSFAWIARFGIQMSGAVVFGYLIYFLQDVALFTGVLRHSTAEAAVGTFSLVAAPIAIFIGLLIGYLTDLWRVRIPLLVGSALAISLALLGMIIWPNWLATFVAFTVFSAGLTAYLTVDAAMIAQLLEKSDNRARTLGLMNLTNTLPAVSAPSLALLLSGTALPAVALLALFSIAAALALLAAMAVVGIKSLR